MSSEILQYKFRISELENELAKVKHEMNSKIEFFTKMKTELRAQLKGLFTWEIGCSLVEKEDEVVLRDAKVEEAKKQLVEVQNQFGVQSEKFNTELRSRAKDLDDKDNRITKLLEELDEIKNLVDGSSKTVTHDTTNLTRTIRLSMHQRTSKNSSSR